MHLNNTVMNNNQKTKWGARIERGRVKAVSGQGYTVESLERQGIVSPPLPALDGAIYTVGATVYFFLFRDGTGAIIGMM